jgi:hypothetical protein
MLFTFSKPSAWNAATNAGEPGASDDATENKAFAALYSSFWSVKENARRFTSMIVFPVLDLVEDLN